MAGWSHSKSCSHQLSVHMETSDECCSSGLHRDHHYVTSLLVTWTVASWALPAHLLMTRNCVVQSGTGGKGRGIQRDLNRVGGTVPASWSSAGPRARSCTRVGAISAQIQTGQRVYQNRSGEKDLGASVDKKFSMTRQYVLTAKKVNHAPGCIQRLVASRSREMILTLCASFLRPHLEFCIQVWCLQQNKDMEQLGKIQSTLGLIPGLKPLCSEARLRVWAAQPEEVKAPGRL